MRDEPQIRISRRIIIHNNQKRCHFIETAGRWSWKLKTDRECVTTHLPNELALKMDGAQACYPYPAAGAGFMPQRVGRRGGP